MNNQTRETLNPKRTSEELAAFKAANRANSKAKAPVLWPEGYTPPER